MTVELRTLRPDQWDTWYAMVTRAFGGVPDEGQEVALSREVTEYERSIAAWDEDEIIGTSGAYSFKMSVPGGAPVPTAGVTMVSVQPTHRRQGVLTAMMRRLLDNVRERGEPLAALVASEPPIYGRFGYGGATTQLSMTIDTDQVRLATPEGTDRVRLRLVEPQVALEACEAVYAQRVPRRPGMIARAPGWERRALLPGSSSRPDVSPLQCVLAEYDGQVTGYARYAVKPEWDDAVVPRGSVLLRDLEALDPVSYAALWRYLFGIDLTSRISATDRPADDPLLHLVSNVRRCGLRTGDQLYLRTVDVAAALQARTYAAPVDLVLQVEDAFCPWNAGRWRLVGDAKGASCERTSDPADLALSVRELSSAYLGGFRLTALAAAGRVQELRPNALAMASAAWGGDIAPWLPHGF